MEARVVKYVVVKRMIRFRPFMSLHITSLNDLSRLAQKQALLNNAKRFQSPALR